MYNVGQAKLIVLVSCPNYHLDLCCIYTVHRQQGSIMSEHSQFCSVNHSIPAMSPIDLFIVYALPSWAEYHTENVAMYLSVLKSNV